MTTFTTRATSTAGRVLDYQPREYDDHDAMIAHVTMVHHHDFEGSSIGWTIGTLKDGRPFMETTIHGEEP